MCTVTAVNSYNLTISGCLAHWSLLNPSLMTSELLPLTTDRYIFAFLPLFDVTVVSDTAYKYPQVNALPNLIDHCHFLLRLSVFAN
uniref:Uncharacterized protein n=1 Tax=Panagrellus redivivus TaxID=6233 RepID=A0A7E5A077_PANRE